MDCGQRTADQGVKCRLQTKGKMKTRGRMQNEDCRLQIRGKMREKMAGNTSAFVEVRRSLLSLKSFIS